MIFACQILADLEPSIPMTCQLKVTIFIKISAIENATFCRHQACNERVGISTVSGLSFHFRGAGKLKCAWNYFQTLWKGKL